MNILAAAVTKNRKGKHDGDEFAREAMAFAKYHNEESNVTTALYSTPKKPAYEALCANLSEFHGNLDVLAIFGHGTSRGLPGFALNTSNIGAFADALIGACGDKITILLYCCLTGRGHYLMQRKRRNEGDRIRSAENVDHREGFAMLLTAELAKRGVTATVYAHLTSGHTTINPFKVRCSSSWFMTCPDSTDPTIQVTRKKIVQPYGATWKHWMERMEGPDRFGYWTRPRLDNSEYYR